MTSTKEKYQFTSIDDAIKIIASGGMLIVVDDESRENEGDLLMAADAITPACVNFMISQERAWSALQWSPIT